MNKINVGQSKGDVLQKMLLYMSFFLFDPGSQLKLAAKSCKVDNKLHGPPALIENPVITISKSAFIVVSNF